ncbi:hypothetical protein C2869_20355 [Saccharobesus litoralis]|uniref:Uncharacterized protein n=1 Tax=Saccharobesus litoralis TaxID=2172099 RepID=A0A2S0VWP2_9ALTE|nr:hypothetical protein [Saccharobesus litoralis]AWB68605.1 hypothetical protein C2869_20355 [Saccharobesus litoralis]
MRDIYGFVLFLLIGCLSSAVNAKNIIGVSFDSDSYSSILPIKNMVREDWNKVPSKDADLAFSANSFFAFWQYHNWRLSVGQRIDYWLDTNTDTAIVYYLDKNNLALNYADSYELDLSLNQQRSHGLLVGYQWQVTEFLTTFLELGYWQVNELRDSRLSGQVSANAQNQILGQANFVEHYTDSNFLKRPYLNDWHTEGNGFSVNLNFDWQVNRDWRIFLETRDLWSRFTIDSLALSEGEINTENNFVSNQGFRSFRPIYKGKETNKDYHFALPRKSRVQSQYQFYDYLLLAEWQHYAGMDFWLVGMGWQLMQSQFQFLFDVENAAPKMQWQVSDYKIQLKMDKLNPNNMTQFQLAFECKWSL